MEVRSWRPIGAKKRLDRQRRRYVREGCCWLGLLMPRLCEGETLSNRLGLSPCAPTWRGSFLSIGLGDRSFVWPI